MVSSFQGFFLLFGLLFVTGQSDTPENVVPLLVGAPVPLIPKNAQKVMKTCCNLTVDYSYYYNVQTGETGHTTPAILDEHKAQLATVGMDKKPSVLSIVSHALFALVAAFLYKRGVTDNRPALAAAESVPAAASMAQLPHDFAFGLCSCCDSPNLACLTCCCPVVRIADTFSTLGDQDFWAFVGGLVGLQVACDAIDMVTDSYGGSIHTALFVCAMVYLRSRLRVRLGAPQPPAAIMLWDGLAWWCCACCAATQDARQIDLAQGVEYKCIAQLEKRALDMEGQALVGVPVRTGAAQE
eukprot:TRINITY_DN94759_c0_g1_i1.p1 TRINITY_DN94759_c0_g1~~TRINITY_DN94759_c0_g1_i1.p1  ORF type:complete len:297 (+),score=34.53 TRINITY_DN94759_c0_g1_i1:69-959(+)